MRILMMVFFHQTTPPGPIRDILEPFSFLENFHVVMYKDTGSRHIRNEVRNFKKYICIVIVNKMFIMVFDIFLL